MPSAETIDDASYKPLTRPLYIYVNKSSYTNKKVVKEFVDFCEIDKKELIKETKAVPKLGILFKNWNKKDFIYSVSEELLNARIGQFNYGFADLIKKQKDSNEFTNKEMWNNKISQKYNIFQYNFNTFYFNEYLLKLCKRMKVKVIDDIIEKVSVNNNKI